MKRILPALLVLIASGVARADAVQMTELDVNGFVLSGAEYWPYHGATTFNYPDDVLWGFYPVAGIPPETGEDPNPATASTAAVDCTTQAWTKLQSFFAQEQPTLKRIIELGGAQGITNKFYLWTDDYTDAATPYPDGLRKNALWYWKRNPPVEGRTPGYWKWESTVLQDGTCLIPQDTQIEQYLRDKLATLES